MMKFQKRFVPLLLALVLALGTPPVQAAALTRGEAACTGSVPSASTSASSSGINRF